MKKGSQMCYDISFHLPANEIKNYFPELEFDSRIEINFDAGIHIMGHSYGEHPVVYASRESGKLHCGLMEWGVIPFYIKDEKQFMSRRAMMLNARSERILDDSKSYWYKIRNRRCLVPVQGFYEHRAVKGWKKKVPYFLELEDQPIFFLPGLYSVAELPDTETGEVTKRWTFTLITRAANDLMKNIHNDGENRYRMPLLLPFSLSHEFVQKDLTVERYREILNYEMPSEQLKYHTVFTIRSGKARPDDKTKDQYWDWEKLPALGSANPD